MVVLTGFHAIEERLKAAESSKAALNGRVLVAGNGPRIKAIEDFARKARVAVERVDLSALKRYSDEHRGVVLVLDADASDAAVSLGEFLERSADAKTSLALVLDHISDPHNYGAILRSCDAFGVDIVIVPSRRSAKETEVVARASAGASAWVPIATVPNLPRAIDELRDAGYWIYATEMKGEDVGRFDPPPRLALVMGAEGSGVSRLLRERCDGSLSVPMRGKVDSLNVSVATGVFLHAVVSRRK
jgi:23S rRNA (guanosine2251-2'-O)-methyltransferase